MKTKYLFTILLVSALISASPAMAESNTVFIIEVADAISPGTAEYIGSGIDKAEQSGAACVIIELDTPGGLAESIEHLSIATNEITVAFQPVHSLFFIKAEHFDSRTERRVVRPAGGALFQDVSCTEGRSVFSVVSKFGFSNLHELTNVQCSLVVGLVF